MCVHCIIFGIGKANLSDFSFKYVIDRSILLLRTSLTILSAKSCSIGIDFTSSSCSS